MTEEKKKVKRESDRNQGTTGVNRWAFAPMETSYNITRGLILLFHHTETGISRSSQVSYRWFYFGQ